MPNISDLLRIGIKVAERAPAGVRFITNAEKVLKTRDPESMMYLIGDGKFDLIETVAGEHYRLGAEAAMPSLERGFNDFLDYVSGNVIEGELVKPDEWVDFVRHLKHLKFGVILIFGSKRYGKTTLAVKLADVFRKQSHYRVECVNMYDEDRPAWATKITMERLVARMRKLGRWLNQAESAVLDDGLTEVDLMGKKAKDGDAAKVRADEIDKLKRRIVIVDEASLLFSSISAAGQTASRETAKALDNQSRHTESIFIFICQKISEMPDNLQADSIKFYKWANPDVVNEDRKDGKVRQIREQWTEALENLQRAKLHPKWYLYPDIRSWAFVKAGDIGGHSAKIIMPFDPLTKEEMAGKKRPDIVEGEIIDR